MSHTNKSAQDVSRVEHLWDDGGVRFTTTRTREERIALIEATKRDLLEDIRNRYRDWLASDSWVFDYNDPNDLPYQRSYDTLGEWAHEENESYDPLKETIDEWVEEQIIERCFDDVEWVNDGDTFPLGLWYYDEWDRGPSFWQDEPAPIEEVTS